VLLVTHDVDEALLLADRVLVLDSGRIATDLRFDVRRPRDPADPRFAQARRTIVTQLGVPPAADALTEPDAHLRAPIATGVTS
jgi:sulfonate transport system ATP-binding protein